ncbi:hypothetical protein ERD32_02010 [Lactobacillus crispatus]|uniref:Uncharacterized protein n=1 Tax=Lactobacillus crispatus TaxID=47770 RepID=A0A4Q0LW91_9LACO|nr:hypothetical protein [Lactobacillus crispatus]RXF59495.1 hypothetical protein ERD32_02010 [Lactobacillus crispatus]
MNKILTFATGVVIGVVYKDTILQVAKQVQAAKDAKFDKKLEEKLAKHFKDVGEQAKGELDKKVPGAFDPSNLDDLY